MFLHIKKCQAVVPPRSITSLRSLEYIAALLDEKKEYSQGVFKQRLRKENGIIELKSEEVKFLGPLNTCKKM